VLSAARPGRLASKRLAPHPELFNIMMILSVFNLNIDIVAPECLNPGLSYHAMPLLISTLFLLIHVGKVLYKLVCTSKRKSQL